MSPAPTGCPAASTMSPAPTLAPGGGSLSSVMSTASCHHSAVDAGNLATAYFVAVASRIYFRQLSIGLDEAATWGKGGDHSVEVVMVHRCCGEQSVDVAADERVEHDLVVLVQSCPIGGLDVHHDLDGFGFVPS